MLFPYQLPQARIAQRPAPSGSSRLLHAQVSGSAATEISDCEFSQLTEVLRAGDLLVVNNSKVIPARFFPEDLGDKAEVLLLSSLKSESGTELWEVLARPMKKCERAGTFMLSEHLQATAKGRSEQGDTLLLELVSTDNNCSVTQLIEQEGVMPIPPYIRGGHADAQDRQRYQTVYADIAGSVAAPTAGLHFTDELFTRLTMAEIEVVQLTHHVGPASFLPVRDGDWQTHKMSIEFFSMSAQVLAALECAISEKRRVVAVGTTCVRALESFFAIDDIEARKKNTNKFISTGLFITPGYQFKVVDVLITNFHQPLSTHLLLVAAFAGVVPCEEIYNHALESDYRFLSYGDGMCIELENTK